MATNQNLKNLSELVSLTADNPRDEAILKRIKDEVIKHLPDGWENWTVCPLSKEDILGEDPDHQVLNRIRFAIPTVGMAQAFHPKSTYLREVLKGNETQDARVGLLCRTNRGTFCHCQQNQRIRGPK
nr:unnamed protein product [Callosobruchus analis]